MGKIKKILEKIGKQQTKYEKKAFTGRKKYNKGKIPNLWKVRI